MSGSDAGINAGPDRYGEGPPDVDALLRLADGVAADLARAAAPVAFRIARSAGELTAIFRLRYRTVVANGWAEAAAMADGLERDRYDDHALHVGGWDADRLVACARLVFPHEGERLPTEEAFDVEVSPSCRVVDVGRGIVDEDHRDRDRRTFTGLLATCWLELRQRGFSTMCGDAAPWLIAIYRGMGFQVDVLGEERIHWGEHRYPIRIDGAASVRSFVARLRQD